MENHFTPGPWAVATGYASNNVTIIQEKFMEKESVPICCISPVSAYNDTDRVNAKLIAAAPELLQACVEMLTHIAETDFDVCGTSDQELKRWRAAIKKATE
jgi:hypothetical protein